MDKLMKHPVEVDGRRETEMLPNNFRRSWTRSATSWGARSKEKGGVRQYILTSGDLDSYITHIVKPTLQL